MSKENSGKVVRLHPELSSRYRADIAKDRNLIGKKIGEARRKLHITQAELSERLAAFGVHVKTPAVNKWECGETSPNAYQLLAICHALEIQNGLSFFTGTISSETDMLNAEGRLMLSRYRELLESNPRYTAKRKNIKKTRVKVSELPASAGYGDEIFEQNFEWVDFPADTVPAGTDFAVRVDGDSMLPVFLDKQTVFIQKCESLRDGEVGLFVYDGKTYIKIYTESLPEEDELEDYMDSDGVIYPKICLESYNDAKYQPIPVTSELRIVGRVLK